jgi:hypothetical protein
MLVKIALAALVGAFSGMLAANRWVPLPPSAQGQTLSGSRTVVLIEAAARRHRAP